MTEPQNQQLQLDEDDYSGFQYTQAKQIMVLTKHIKALNKLLEETKAKLPEANKE